MSAEAWDDNRYLRRVGGHVILVARSGVRLSAWNEAPTSAAGGVGLVEGVTGFLMLSALDSVRNAWAENRQNGWAVTVFRLRKNWHPKVVHHRLFPDARNPRRLLDEMVRVGERDGFAQLDDAARPGPWWLNRRRMAQPWGASTDIDPQPGRR
ncbi:hypothetical protein FB554_2821 [Barrientosiimonas humi]|uniref:Uncharacterized protein n=1 Tax=Barrientosiimonas humi TaxID=999931 RepID=A0A542XFQ3_9MICO|nr:hypothetical protein [Barrientosiimonas humi]TQL34645.1 hypothetical protein FB554_2821 [Barrientosiimonas humi]CAG7574635.1 hypothetical protein BH39T_PBIAJDOK_03291 [Barrientosiimonas humi]